MMKRRPLIGMMVASLGLGALGARGAPNAGAGAPVRKVKEPLQVPALATQLGPSSALMAITRAGQRLVAVGALGHVLYSDDHGRVWQQAAVPVSVDLVAVQFVSPQEGWVCGHDGAVLHSTDAGVTWRLVLEGRGVAQRMVAFYNAESQAHPGEVMDTALAESQAFEKEAGARPFLGICFTDARNGFAVGAWGLILHTADGGQTWEPWLHRVDNPELKHLNAVRVLGSDVWIAGEAGMLWRLDAAAQRFVRVPVPEAASLFGLNAVPGGLIVYGLLGRAFVSFDDGRTWARSSGLGPSGITASTLLSDGRVVLVDVSARVWISADHGRHFTELRPQLPMPYTDVVAVSAGELVLTGLGGVRQQAIGAP